MPAGRRKVAKKNKSGRGGRPSAAESAEAARIVDAAFKNLMAVYKIRRQFGERRRAVTAPMVLRELKSNRGCEKKYGFRLNFPLPTESSINRILGKLGKPSRFRPYDRRNEGLENHDDGKGPSRFSQ